MHLSNSIDCVVQGKFWLNSIPCCQPCSVKSPNHCNSAPSTLSHTQETFIPINMSTIHLSRSLQESTTSPTLWNRAWEMGCASAQTQNQSIQDPGLFRTEKLTVGRSLQTYPTPQLMLESSPRDSICPLLSYPSWEIPQSLLDGTPLVTRNSPSP